MKIVSIFIVSAAIVYSCFSFIAWDILWVTKEVAEGEPPWRLLFLFFSFVLAITIKENNKQ